MLYLVFIIQPTRRQGLWSFWASGCILSVKTRLDLEYILWWWSNLSSISSARPHHAMGVPTWMCHTISSQIKWTAIVFDLSTIHWESNGSASSNRSGLNPQHHVSHLQWSLMSKEQLEISLGIAQTPSKIIKLRQIIQDSSTLLKLMTYSQSTKQKNKKTVTLISELHLTEQKNI